MLQFSSHWLNRMQAWSFWDLASKELVCIESSLQCLKSVVNTCIDNPFWHLNLPQLWSDPNSLNWVTSFQCIGPTYLSLMLSGSATLVPWSSHPPPLGLSTTQTFFRAARSLLNDSYMPTCYLVLATAPWSEVQSARPQSTLPWCHPSSWYPSYHQYLLHQPPKHQCHPTSSHPPLLVPVCHLIMFIDHWLWHPMCCSLTAHALFTYVHALQCMQIFSRPSMLFGNITLSGSNFYINGLQDNFTCFGESLLSNSTYT